MLCRLYLPSKSRVNMIDSTFATIMFVAVLVIYFITRKPAEVPKVDVDKCGDVKITHCPKCKETIGIEVEGIIKAEPNDSTHCPFCNKTIRS